MKTPDTLLGFVVLGVVLAGVFWARDRSGHAGREGPASIAQAGPSPVSSVPSSSWSPGSSSAPSWSPGSSDPGNPDPDSAIPDVTVEDGVADLGDVRVILSVAPRPPIALAKRLFRVRVESAPVNGGSQRPGAAPPVLGNGRISFEMTMPMGEHRYTLAPAADGWDEAVVVLPSCASGNPRWYATVEGTVAGRPLSARFKLDLTKH